MNLLIIIGVFFVHWFADFVLQTDWQAKNKSKDNKALLSHTLTYSSVWLGVSLVFGLVTMPWLSAIWFAIWFTLVTFVAHTITDYFTSRLNTKLWTKGDVHNFFVSVGFDQVLHYAQLYITLYLLTR
jgi:hypothetical protein